MMHSRSLLLLALSITLAACGGGGGSNVGAQTGTQIGNQTGGSQTGGNQTGGNQTGGSQTGGNQTGGNQTGGSQTGGNQTGGNQTGGNQTGGNQTGGQNNGANSGSQSAANNGLLIPTAGANKLQVQALSSNNRNQIIVDGTPITLEYSGISAGAFSNLSANGVKTIVSGRMLSYSRFGMYQQLSGGDMRVLSLGEVTSDMPSAGTAVYKGNVVEVGNAKAGENYPIYAHHEGTFTANVDFGAKTLNASIEKVGGYKDLPRDFTATINGAEFSGTGGMNSGISSVQGKFYGPQAAEIGGVYAGEARQYEFAGAFGGKKQ